MRQLIITQFLIFTRPHGSNYIFDITPNQVFFYDLIPMLTSPKIKQFISISLYFHLLDTVPITILLMANWQTIVTVLTWPVLRRSLLRWSLPAVSRAVCPSPWWRGVVQWEHPRVHSPASAAWPGPAGRPWSDAGSAATPVSSSPAHSLSDTTTK